MTHDEPFTLDLLKDISPFKAIGVILLISGVALGFLVWLIYFKGGSDYSSTLITSLTQRLIKQHQCGIAAVWL